MVVLLGVYWFVACGCWLLLRMREIGWVCCMVVCVCWLLFVLDGLLVFTFTFRGVGMTHC